MKNLENYNPSNEKDLFDKQMYLLGSSLKDRKKAKNFFLFSCLSLFIYNISDGVELFFYIAIILFSLSISSFYFSGVFYREQKKYNYINSSQEYILSIFLENLEIKNFVEKIKNENRDLTVFEFIKVENFLNKI